MSDQVQSQQQDIINKLKEVPFFSMFSKNDGDMQKIAKMCSTRSIKQGKEIISEGEYGDELFIILDGNIDILKRTLQNDKYTVTTLSADMGGINVGELALIDNDQRSASVVAKSDCKCLVITRDAFIKFGDENPYLGLQITRAIASQLSSRLRKANSDIITLFSALVEEISDDEMQG